MKNVVELDFYIRDEIKSIAKYGDRNLVNIEVLITMVKELLTNLQGQRPCEATDKENENEKD